ncbi:winged helix-turn-helix domain-containing protein [Desulfovibrio gilichinskyi]|uniref:Molybdate transport system regulatory protein n=1 Tax=Desulfovibrio gilichinskyi TaxID=1519643 RepID=A0A1X7E6S5_9BACT|nr:LysR family transcriptional regulator [Desulfovibrio gilichinskyi]SMF28370.1 molybdate transport system regulatory protein [Desulfovibrio gilichinskyi]
MQDITANPDFSYLNDPSAVDGHSPTIRLHLWLEGDEGVFFGYGRLQLLDQIEKCGSLKKAAEELGMSYRAAWGKIKQTEQVLGFQLIERIGCRRSGYRLTEAGRLVRDKFFEWFKQVECDARQRADEIFPWRSKSFGES